MVRIPSFSRECATKDGGRAGTEVKRSPEQPGPAENAPSSEA